MKRNTTIVLFFLANGNLTAQASEAATAIEKGLDGNVSVRFRNGTVPVTGKLEVCDFIAGDPIPAEYAQTYRTINADGSANEPNTSNTVPEGDGAQTGAVPQGGAQTDPLAQEIGSVNGQQGGQQGGWGA